MIKKLCKLNNLLSVIAAAFICLTTVTIPSASAEGGPDLTIETLEVKKEDIPEDGYVKLKVRIGNNPGINAIVFSVQADSRIYTKHFYISEREIPGIASWGGAICDPEENIISADAVFNIDEWYYDNDVFLSLGFFLPDNCQPGDFFAVNFHEGVDNDPPRYNSADGAHFNNESFGTLTSGGIRIISDSPVQGEPDDSQQHDPVPADQLNPEPNQQTPPPQQNQQETDPHTEPVTTSESTVSSVPCSTSLTRIVTSVSHASSPVTDITSTSNISQISETRSVSSSFSHESKKNDTDKKRFIIPLVIVLACALSVVIFNYKRRKNN